MRESRFWELMTDEFGAGYARSLAHAHVVTGLGGRTVVELLAAGEPPRTVWLGICEDFDVPAERRLGRDVVQAP